MNQKIKIGISVFLLLSLLFAGSLLLGGINASQQIVKADEETDEETDDEVKVEYMPLPCPYDIPEQCPQNASDETKKITVSAQGVVTVDPDIAYIRLSIQEQRTTAKEASDAVNLKMQDVFKVMEEMGVEKKDLKTLNFNLSPQYNYQNSPPDLYAYQAENRVEVTVRDMEQVGELLAAALDAGANNVETVSYDLKDKTEAYEEALKLAVQSAADKAGIMAEALSVQVDPVPRLLSESKQESYGIFNNYMSHMEEAKAAGGMGGDMGAAAPVALAANQIVITAYVEAAYDIVP